MTQNNNLLYLKNTGKQFGFNIYLRLEKTRLKSLEEKHVLFSVLCITPLTKTHPFEPMTQLSVNMIREQSMTNRSRTTPPLSVVWNGELI